MALSSASGSPPGAHFQAIDDTVFLRVPDMSVTGNSNSTNPTVILIFGWMGAKLSHVYKYADTHRKLYPEATQILVQSSPSFFWSSRRTRQARLAPAVEALEALGVIPQLQDKRSRKALSEAISHVPNHRILVHAFSNGGSYQMVTLGQLLLARSRNVSTSTPRMPSAIILDSCPGSGGLRNSIRAFSVSIRNPLLRYLVMIVLSVSHVTRRLLSIFLRIRTPLQVLQDALHNPSVLPWVNSRTPRLYIYSKNDDMVPWEQVSEHAEEAKRRGLIVEDELFDESEHVSHARRNPARYWGAVKKTWEKVVDRK